MYQPHIVHKPLPPATPLRQNSVLSRLDLNPYLGADLNRIWPPVHAVRQVSRTSTQPQYHVAMTYCDRFRTTLTDARSRLRQPRTSPPAVNHRPASDHTAASSCHAHAVFSMIAAPSLVVNVPPDIYPGSACTTIPLNGSPVQWLTSALRRTGDSYIQPSRTANRTPAPQGRVEPKNPTRRNPPPALKKTRTYLTA